MERVKETNEHLTCEQQDGFREGGGCADQIFTLMTIAEKLLGEREDTICCIYELGEGL